MFNDVREYSAALRRTFIKERLESWGHHWDQETKALIKHPNGKSVREIGLAVQKYFGQPKPVSPATLQRDLGKIKAELGQKPREQIDEAERLLRPENFAEWRNKMFKVKRGGVETPPHQLAWFWVMRAVALKQPMPMWVIEYLDLPPDVNDSLDDDDVLQSLILLAPPRHGKTMLVQHVIIWLICVDPNIRIIYSNGTDTITRQGIDFIRNELEFNETLNEMYGPFKSDSKGLQWSSTGFIVGTRTINMASLTVRGVSKGSAVLSLDADVIFVDDPQQPKDAQSEATTASDYNWMTVGVMTRREPHTGFLGLGSHQVSMTGDLWSWIEDSHEELNSDEHRLIFKKLPAHDYEKCSYVDNEHVSEDCLLWPGFRGFKFLEAMRAILGDDVMFEAVYNQVPRSKNMEYFSREVVRGKYVMGEFVGKEQKPPLDPGGILDTSRTFKKVPKCCGFPTLVVMGFDPAASEKKGGSFSALIVLAGCRVCKRRYLVDYWHERVSPEHHPNILKRYMMAYPEISRLQIEINAYQKSLSRNFQLQEYAQKYRVEIEEWTTDERKADPFLGIPMIAGTMRGGLFSMPFSTRQDAEYAEPFIKTLLRWPKKPNDLVMALWLADVCLEGFIDEYENLGDDLMPGHYRSQFHEENDEVVDLGAVWDEEYLVLG